MSKADPLLKLIKLLQSLSARRAWFTVTVKGERGQIVTVKVEQSYRADSLPDSADDPMNT